jgi:hypothetical protein
MDLINASAEECAWRYNNVVYTFPPNELITVSDAAGHHLARKLAPRGVVAVSYGDNPTEIKLSALREVVAYHRRQIKAHEDQVKVATDQRTPIPAEPESYPAAKIALKVYAPVLEKAENEEKERSEAETSSKMRAALDAGMETVELEDMDQDQLRAMVRSLGAEADMRHGPKKLIAQIKKLRGKGE